MSLPDSEPPPPSSAEPSGDDGGSAEQAELSRQTPTDGDSAEQTELSRQTPTDGGSAGQAEPRAPAPARPPGRFRRALAVAAAALGLSAVFLGAAGTALVLHLGSPPARRIVQSATNQLLGSIFDGKIVAGEIENLSIHGADIRSAVVVDPRGGQVIRATGIHAHADVLGLVRNALLGEGDVLITIPRVIIDHADVLVEMGPAGEMTIAEAFTPKEEPPPPTPPEPPVTKPRIVRVALPRIEIGTAWVHGLVAPPRALDADVSRLVGSVLAGPDGVSVDVEQTGLVDRTFLPARTAGSAHYHLRAGANVGPGATEDTLRMWTGFAGQLGDVIVIARATIEDNHLSATAEIPVATPDNIASVLPGIPLEHPLSAQVDLEGDIPWFDVSGRVTLHPSAPIRGDVAVSGRFDAGNPRFELDFSTHDFDPRLFGEDLPAGDIDVQGRMRIDLTTDVPRLAVDAHSEPTTLLGQPVPAADLHAVLDRGELSGTAFLYENGMPTSATFVLVPDDGLHFEAESDIPSIDAAPRIRGPMRGSAHVRTVGVLRGEELDARVEGRVTNLLVSTGPPARAPANGEPGDAATGAPKRDLSEISLGEGSVSGRIAGPLNAIRVDGTLTGTDVRAGGYHFDRIKASARGPALAPRLDAELVDDDEGSVRASGQLDAQGAAVRGVKLAITRKDTSVTGEIARIGARAGGVAIEGLKLDGDSVGSVEASLAVTNGDVTGKLKGEGVDLARLTALLGIVQRVRGVANVDVAIERTKSGRQGHVKLELEGGEISLLNGLSAQLTANFKDDEVTADGLVRLVATPTHLESDEDLCDGTIAQIRFSRGAGAIHGPLLAASTWERASGEVQIAAEEWDLRCLARLAPLVLPVSEIKGKANTRFTLSRAPADRFPSIKDLFFRTRGLEVVIPRPAEKTEEEPQDWESRSIDVQVKGGIDGSSGRTRVQLTLYDGDILGDVDLGLELDLPALVDGNKPGQRWATFKSTALSGSFGMPSRKATSFDTLPKFIAENIPALDGEVRVQDGTIAGTVEQPFVLARVIGHGISAARPTGPKGARGASAMTENEWALPLDIVTLLTYDSHKATLAAHATRDGVGIATANAEIDADLRALLAPRKEGEKAPWTGQVHAQISELSLGDIPFLADHGVAGHLKGTMTATGLNDRPVLALDLRLPDLQIGPDLSFRRANVSLHIDPALDDETSAYRAVARATLEQSDGGRLDAAAHAAIIWRDGIVPTIDPAKPADIDAQVDQLRLAALFPLVSSVFSKLDGRVDGKVKIGWESEDDEDARVDVDLRVSAGEFHIPQLGQELRNARVHVVAKPGATRAATTVVLEDIAAQAVSGQITGAAVGDLQGLRFTGGRGEFLIKRGEELPITFEGVPLGNARGRITIEAKKDPQKVNSEIAMTIGLRDVHLDLPDSSGRAVQPLDDHPELTPSHPSGIEKEPRSPDALRWALTFDIAPLHIEGSGVDIKLSGSPQRPPKVVLSDTVHLSGDIQIDSGRFERFGKVFLIEPTDRPGLVRLRAEDAGNPYLNVRAHWDAPDGSRIFVDYIGVLKPITNEKLRFTSSDGRPPDQIFQLLLFGADAAEAAARPDQRAGGVAVGLGGGIAAEQFNALLSGIAPLRGLSTRIGTSEEGALKTTVTYQIVDTVSASATVEGAPTVSGGSTSAAADQRTGAAQLNVDWRFHPKWSISSKLGVRDQQTTIGADLLWQYRY